MSDLISDSPPDGGTPEGSIRLPKRVVVVGATGFVGQHLIPELQAAGHDVVGTTRHPEAAAARWPERKFVRLDMDDPASIRDALRGARAAVYLVHGMAQSGDYEYHERLSATRFLDAATEEGVTRIVYLGGVRPTGRASKHLRSRLATGAILRAGHVSTIELRATMIIGAGSESWLIVRDLATRLPAMILPRWLKSKSQPVAIDDVCKAICAAVDYEVHGSQVYSLPGPETLAADQIILRTAALAGTRPLTMGVPLLSPRLSSYWIGLVTRANLRVASELVEGLQTDIVAREEPFWPKMNDYRPMGFDVAASKALADDRRGLSSSVLRVEEALRSLAPAAAGRASARP